MRVTVGMSGGVDSSVAALLLRRSGVEVSGTFMKNWEEDDPDYPCTALDDMRDALEVCERLSIDLTVENFTEEYRQRVFREFLQEYEAGRTPNPDILCNREIKFRAFLDSALENGADRIATGHYARVDCVDGRFRLLRGCDRNKDQSYFLYALDQKALSRSLFPVGELKKTEVRRLAAEAGFGNHAKKDSTGICFIGERRFTPFLQRYLFAQPGDIVTPEGRLIGTHKGAIFYTLGQRSGLGIGGVADCEDLPWFVVDKDLSTNTITVAQGNDHPLLYSDALEVVQVNWIAGTAPELPRSCSAKIRYRQPDQHCRIEVMSHERLLVHFDVPQRAVTPGQSVVFYDGEECLGGGVIDKRICQ
ncbi:MAG: tRNA 2-thiouridine(34) synthase MnmA [Gammaproteobacteria bacterium]|nr:MAG: tRNA 2-thiouridine(34) synthase MnmA [Gammaproteobacteria bacterium]